MVPGRFVLSRPGFNASDPALSNVNKIIDSHWQFSGSLIVSGSFAWQASFPYTILFPTALHFVPAALAWLMVGDGTDGSECVFLSGDIKNDRLVLTGWHGAPFGGSTAGTLHYQVFGV